MQARYEDETRALQGAVRLVVTDLVVGAHATPSTKRALLQHVHALAQFLGRRYPILPMMPGICVIGNLPFRQSRGLESF